MALESSLRELLRELVREEIRAVLGEPRGSPQVLEPGAMPMEPEGEGLWDVAKTCAFLNVSSSWLYHRAAAGTIPCIRVGHNLRFDPAAIKAWTRGERRGGRVVPLK